MDGDSGGPIKPFVVGGGICCVELEEDDDADDVLNKARGSRGAESTSISSDSSSCWFCATVGSANVDTAGLL